jgi:hypothetical protein
MDKVRPKDSLIIRIFVLYSIKSNDYFRVFPIEFIQVRKFSQRSENVMIILGLTLDQFIDFVHSHNHQIDREDQNRETFLILDRTCK